MLSTLLDVLGLAALVAGVFVLAGPGYALLASCPALMFIAYATDDQAANVALKRLLNAPRVIVRRVRGRKRKART